jgi:hypothetical protein
MVSYRYLCEAGQSMRNPSKLLSSHAHSVTVTVCCCKHSYTNSHSFHIHLAKYERNQDRTVMSQIAVQARMQWLVTGHSMGHRTRAWITYNTVSHTLQLHMPAQPTTIKQLLPGQIYTIGSSLARQHALWATASTCTCWCPCCAGWQRC